MGNHLAIRVGSALLATLALAAARGGEAPCGRCGSPAAGLATPCGETGCGPRYRGAIHDEPGVPDPCDGCGNWIGCDGSRPPPEMLAPWQLPPGRGFTRPADLGYTRPIGVCGEGLGCGDEEPCCDCGHRPPWRPFWWF